MSRVVGEQGVIELRHQTVGRTVPKLENPSDKASTSHVVGKPVVGEQIESGGMGCRRSGIGLQIIVAVEQPDVDALTTQKPST